MDLAVAAIILGADADPWLWRLAVKQKPEGVLLVSFEPGVASFRNERKKLLENLIYYSGFHGTLADERVGAILWTMWLR